MNRRQPRCILSVCFYIFCIFSHLVTVSAKPLTGTSISTDSGSGIPVKTATVATSDGGVSLAVPKTKTVSPTELLILSEIERGTPTSLRSAVSRIRQQGASMNDSDKLLLYVASSIYAIVYPTERLNWEVPKVSSSAYVNIIESAKMGAYDFGAAKTDDFLSQVLPSLVLFTAPNVKNYYVEAEKSLVTATKQNSESVLAHYLLGTLYQRQSNYALATKEFENAFRMQPNCVTIAVPYIETLLSEQRAKEAYNAAVKVLLKNNGNTDIIKLCAEAAFAMDDWELAEQYVSQILQSDSANPRFQLLRARILLESGDFVRASSALEVYAKSEKPNRLYYVVRAKLLRDWNKNYQSAAATVSTALIEYPEDFEILLLAADIASASGLKVNDLSASQLASKILGNDPSNADALAIMIKEALKNEQWQTAYDRSSRLLQVRNDDTAKLLRIDACLGLNKVSEAQELAKGLYRADSESEDIQNMYIRVLIETKNTAEASALIEKILPPSSQKNKSILYYQRSRLASDPAIKLSDLRNSLTSNPRNENALYDLYKYYYNKKDYRKALYYLKQVIALKPSDQKLLKQQSELDKLLAQ